MPLRIHRDATFMCVQNMLLQCELCIFVTMRPQNIFLLICGRTYGFVMHTINDKLCRLICGDVSVNSHTCIFAEIRVNKNCTCSQMENTQGIELNGFQIPGHCHNVWNVSIVVNVHFSLTENDMHRCPTGIYWKTLKLCKTMTANEQSFS